MMLDGFSIEGYRSFGSRVEIADLDKVNVFIGPNNCGKSNVLRFVNLVGAFLATGQQPMFDPKLDNNLESKAKEVKYGIQVKEEGFTNALFQNISKPFKERVQAFFPQYGESVWFDFHFLREPNKSEKKPTPESLARIQEAFRNQYNKQQQNLLASTLLNYNGGSLDGRIADLAANLHKEINKLQINVHLIDAFRRITEKTDEPFLGAGMIQELRRLQSPKLADRESSEARFAKIVGFLQSILGNRTADLKVPAEENVINVSLDGKWLPLDSLGTGIHELIILATAVTVVDDAIFCIEEPEIHLHPRFQKKFLRYIKDNTNNQYLIATHSNAFFDIPGVNIYRCRLEKGLTTCDLVSEAADKHAILMDLGYRPSDLLQANYVIWVEGPSDRIYLNWWLKTKDPKLIEGLDYTIMIYGGRLLSHLSYDEGPEVQKDVDDFIHLSRLNRNACIVMDRDKDNADDPINDTKTRVETEFKQNDCLTWVTGGRTIENYIPEDILNDAIAAVHPKTERKQIKWKPFEDVTRLRKGKNVDKVAVARHVADRQADFSMLDLDAALDRLVVEIRRCNAGEQPR